MRKLDIAQEDNFLQCKFALARTIIGVINTSIYETIFKSHKTKMRVVIHIRDGKWVG